MAEEQFTRCPGCKTIFRVTEPQLALRDGQVRCGHCRTVFDGRAAMVSLAAQPEASDDEAELGPPTVTLRPARALKTVDEAEPVPSIAAAGRPRPAAPRRRPSRRVPIASGRTASPGTSRASAGPPGRGSRSARCCSCCCWPRRRRGTSATRIAAHFPGARPLLAQACALVGCTIRPLRDVAAVSIEASDLQADAAHRGLLILNATVRNRANYAIAFPYLELTLTDAQDQPVVRRAFAPQEFAGGTTDLAAGHPGAGRGGGEALRRRQRHAAGRLPPLSLLSLSRRTDLVRCLARGMTPRTAVRNPGFGSGSRTDAKPAERPRLLRRNRRTPTKVADMHDSGASSSAECANLVQIGRSANPPDGIRPAGQGLGRIWLMA